MPSSQQFLFEPEKPLVTRLGKHFFKTIPKEAGVYLMKNAAGKIVYVGKAKNLRQRLRSYRVANPERLSRRHLRLLQQVTSIEFNLCADETAALKHEAKLIRELKPKFNRAGVWQGKPQFLIWRFTGLTVEFSIQETPRHGWERFGPFGAYAPRLKSVLVRMFWLAMNPDKRIQQMPCGWMQDRLPDVVEIECAALDEPRVFLEAAFWGEAAMFLNWCVQTSNPDRPLFERTVIARDFEELEEFFEKAKSRGKNGQRMLI